jgi:2-polyprenyl-6-methoxyphenol hydroxylase-like FAD-dependent oxidoreductase
MKNEQKRQVVLPVLIAGAGPTGLTAAMELSRMGVAVRIIDKAKGPSETSRALAVQSRTVELFEQRGLSAKMLELGNPAHATAIYNEKKLLGKVDLSRIRSRYNFCLLVSQAQTEGLLREQVTKQGVTIEWNTEMTGFTQSPDGRVIATIESLDGKKEYFSASYLISAEGAHSIARASLNLDFTGKTMGQNYALGDLYIDGDIPEDELSVFISKKGFVALFPMGDKRFRMMVTDPENHTKKDAPPSIVELQKLFNSVVHIPAKLYEMNWASRYGINSRMMETLKVGNIFFGGDAAHIHSPAGGQGMNTGIQDMINLCWKLAFVIKGKANDELLSTFEEERIPVIKHLLATTEKATDMFNSLNPLVYTLMSAFIPPLLGLNFIQKKETSVISEVANEYKDSRLSKYDHPIGELQAGLRIPNTELKLNAFSTSGKVENSYLYQLLNPSLFTILLVNEGIEALPAINGLELGEMLMYQISPATDVHRIEFQKIFGDQPGFVLVRPDSYVAVSGRMDRVDLIGTWVKSWLIN